jgi:hypothetical protein
VRCVGSQVVPKNDRGTHDQALLRWVSLSRKRSGARPRPWPPDGLTGGGPQLAMPRNRFSASAASRSRLPTHLPWIGAASCGPMLREAAGGRVLARPQQTAGSSAIIGRGPVAPKRKPRRFQRGQLQMENFSVRFRLRPICINRPIARVGDRSARAKFCRRIRPGYARRRSPRAPARQGRYNLHR